MKMSLLAFGIGLAFSGQASALCPGGTAPAGGFAGKTVVVADNAVYFATKTLQLDFDGSPRAYGVRDQGLEEICDGLAPLAPPECKGKTPHGACYTACEQTFAKWSHSGAKPGDLQATMCSIGLGGGECSKPALSLQVHPREDWFLSETSLHVAPATPTPLGPWLRSQAAQLDPSVVRYFVIPGRFVRAPWHVAFGDVGVILDNRHPEHVTNFIVGDGGGNLDEASLALHVALKGDAAPQPEKKRSALGKIVDRYTSGSNGDFRVVIFRNTASLGNSAAMTTLTAEKVNDWVTELAKNKLAAVGGTARLTACTARPASNVQVKLPKH